MRLSIREYKDEQMKKLDDGKTPREMRKVKSELPLNYATIKVTKSRINKGLLAIPVSLIDLFPKNRKKIFLIDENGKLESKTFIPYTSSSRECRIGGLKQFYEKYQVYDGDELFVQLVDNDVFRIIPERIFQNILSKQLYRLQHAINDEEAENVLSEISQITTLTKTEFLKNEFVILSREKIEDRKRVEKKPTLVRENVPYFIRKILLALYSGRCQVTNFTFLTKNGSPYFELHHIHAEKGNHLKNLLVVSPNTHAQFTYANVEQYFDDEGWLRKVKFNGDEFNVFQIIDNLPQKFEKEIHG